MNRETFPSTHSIQLKIREQHLWLLPEKAIFWEEKSYLILTDLHLGKAGHFRKAGIPIPTRIHQADLDNLQYLIDTFQPEGILMLGDLFHSAINLEWNDFRQFLHTNSSLPFFLVKGNHDILPQDAYHESNLTVYEEQWLVGPFCFTHHPVEQQVDDYFVMCGHLHPGYKIRVKGGQHFKLPCYHLAPHQMLLPAFGKFTGCMHIPKKYGQRVFAIVPGKEKNRVMEV